ncbi:MAG: cytochrome C oxidase subunit IV family protein [candidate division FCPU426 bacterium]
MSENKHEHGWGQYYLVFNALIFLTVITVSLSYFDLGGLLTSGVELVRSIKLGPVSLGFLPDIEIGHGANILVGMIVAVIKASLVLWFFMHQREEEGVNRLAFGFCVALFFLALTVFSFDFVWLKTYAFEELAQAAVGGG